MLITRSQFARKMGVTPTAVGKAVKSGRLTLADGKRLDWKVACIQWEANRQRPPPMPAPPRVAPRPAPPAPAAGNDDLEFTPLERLWFAMVFDPPTLSPALDRWLTSTGNAPAPPLVAALATMCEHFGANIDRLLSDDD